MLFRSAEGNIDVRCNTADVCGSSLEAVGSVSVKSRNTMKVAPTAALYPNPARETVAVHIDNADATHPVTVRLCDGYGRPCAEQTSTGATSLQFSTAQLSAGLYFVHILQGRQVLSRQQLRIEK